MKLLTNLFNEISNISSTSDKIEFIKNHQDKIDFINTIKFLIDPNNITGISSKKWNKAKIYRNCLNFTNFTNSNEIDFQRDIFDYLLENHTGRDEDIYYLKSICHSWCEDNEDFIFFEKLITKNIQIGIQAKNLNKAIPNLVNSFDIALCSKYENCKDIINDENEYEITIKIDGARCIAIKENGSVKLFSRQGKQWLGLKNIENAIKNINDDNFVIDGELTINNFMNYSSNEVYKQTTKIISSKNDNKQGITLNCFDYLTLDEWNNECITVQKIRRQQLLQLLKDVNNNDLFYLPTLYIGNNSSQIMKIMNDLIIPNKYEGLVIKLTNSIYEHKRTKNWIKLKIMNSYDLTIVDYFEGENKYKNKLGGFICEITLPDGKFVHTKVGSGFSDQERIDLWENPQSFIGKNIEILGFELTINNKTNFYSIRFPIFKCFIPDGKILNGDYLNI